ncbi:MAG: adenylate/guanylate cyclase domain-containing protein [Gemmatimonadota bacterium]
MFAVLRETLAGKILMALVGTVGVLLVVTYVVVQSETDRQVDLVTHRAVETASQQFQELEKIQRRQAARLGRPLVEGRRTLAALDEAIEAQDRTVLANLASYELDLARLEDVLVVFTDPDGHPVLTLHNESIMEGADPVGLASEARRLLDSRGADLQMFRVLDSTLYRILTRVVELAGRPIGTLSLGLPLRDADVQAIGDLVGVEVCFIVEGACVAGTRGAREGLSASLAATAPEPGEFRARAMERPWSVRVEPLIAGDPAQGLQIIAVPLDGVVAPFRRIQTALVAAGVASILLAIFMGLLLSRGLTRPVRALMTATGKVAQGDYDTEVQVQTRDEVGTLAAAFNEMTRGLRLKEQYRSVLNKVVSEEVAHELVEGGVELGGENREVSVLFADIRGFSAITEGMEPQEVIHLLNECMQHLSESVEAEGGIVDKYVGDELMAVFGAPVRVGDESLRAVRAAARMQRALAAWNTERSRKGLEPLRIGIGINSGVVVAGNMGSANRLNYTVLGDVVNLASRLCSLAGPGEILVSARTLEEAGPQVVVDPHGPQSVKGFSAEVDVFRVREVREAGEAPMTGGDAADPSPGGMGVRRPSTSTGRGLAVLVGLVVGGLGAGGAPLAAQAPGWPVLSDLGVGYLSPSGQVQVGVSGQMDLEALEFSGSVAGLATGSGGMLAPRLRVFTDLFLGSNVYALVELRGDRGPGPSEGNWEGRLEQAFVRVGTASGRWAIQMGKFASPFGTYAGIHLSANDNFVRPPLPYDFRTVICPTIAPPSTERFLAWKLEPERFRPTGAPPVWGVPYPWGLMATGTVGRAGLRAAVVNSMPSSEPEAWGWDPDRFRHPSLVAGAFLPLTDALTVDASWSRGPYLEELVGGDVYVQARRFDYVQEIFSLAGTLARGPLTVRAEIFYDRWEVPNVPRDAVDVGYTAEVQMDLMAGFFAAARFGLIDFRPLRDPDASRGVSGGGNGTDWDDDVARYEMSLGYRLARNAGILVSGSITDQVGPRDMDDNLLAARLWWAF